MNNKIVRGIIISAINDSRSREPTGPDHFADEVIKLLAQNDVSSVYKIAWTKLVELLIVLDKADCKVLDPHDLLNITTYLITSSVCIKDSTGIKE